MQPISTPPTQPPSPEVEQRDKGLARVRSLTMWLGGGALVATGAFAAWVAIPHSAEADSKTSKASTARPVDPRQYQAPGQSQNPSAGRSQSGSAPSTVAPSTNQGQRQVTPPQQAPRQSRTRPRAGSGGS